MSRIQQIFRDHADEYLERFGDRIPEAHRKVIDAIRECRSGARGHHVFECPECGEYHVANSSCGNRHCPVCQNDKASEWVYRQQLRLLPCTYFLGTFTVPGELHAVARSHQKVVYGAMVDQAASSLRTLEADPRFVGCKVAGFFSAFHTWGRQLQYHPHVHFVIPGGGLDAERKQWRNAASDFLVHVRALSRMFRGKMHAALKKAQLLHLVPQEVWTKEWVVHCEPVGDGRTVMKYLGAYVFRVAISDARIVSYDGTQVTFSAAADLPVARKYQKVDSTKWRRITLSVMEFMRRFLQHTLPKGFMKVRHFGFLSPNFGVTIQRIRELICVLYELLRNCPVKLKPPRKPEPPRCPKCRAIMKWRCFMPPVRMAFSP